MVSFFTCFLPARQRLPVVQQQRVGGWGWLIFYLKPPLLGKPVVIHELKSSSASSLESDTAKSLAQIREKRISHNARILLGNCILGK